jgi:hypothetical protein
METPFKEEKRLNMNNKEQKGFLSQILQSGRTACKSPSKIQGSPTRKNIVIPAMNNQFKYTLVLDLDETLVHFESSERKFKIRPNCITFLKNLSHLFEIVVFTAAS